MSPQPMIHAFFHDATNTITYLLWDAATGEGAVIDPVLDFDPASGVVDTRAADAVLALAEAQGVAIGWVLETHAHADHLTAAAYIRLKTGAKVGVGDHIGEVQAVFAPLFDARDLAPDGADFDALFAHGDRIRLGDLQVEVLHTPGHTPADVSYRIADAVFVGDTLFMPDYGTARTDFPGGDARALYRSIRTLLSLPPRTRLFLCHDYAAPGREAHAWETSVGDQRAHNIHIRDGVGEDDFVAVRRARDATLAAPRLLLASIQVNIRAGRFPPPAANGTRYILTPVKAVGPAAMAAIA